MSFTGVYEEAHVLSCHVVLLQELQCGPCDGKSDGAPLRLRPDLHHRKNHFSLLPPEAGGAAIPDQSEGGGCHAQVQTPGQISGEGTEKHQSASKVNPAVVTSCRGLSLWYLLEQWFHLSPHMLVTQ